MPLKLKQSIYRETVSDCSGRHLGWLLLNPRGPCSGCGCSSSGHFSSASPGRLIERRPAFNHQPATATLSWPPATLVKNLLLLALVMSCGQSVSCSLFFNLGQLGRPEFECQLVDRTGELER